MIITSTFFIFWNFFYYADDRGHENHEARNARVCAECI